MIVVFNFSVPRTRGFAVAVLTQAGHADFYDEHHNGWRLAGIVQADSKVEAAQIYHTANPEVAGVFASELPAFIETIQAKRAAN